MSANDILDVLDDLRTGRRPPQTKAAIERMRREREERELWKLMGHEIAH